MLMEQLKDLAAQGTRKSWHYSRSETKTDDHSMRLSNVLSMRLSKYSSWASENLRWVLSGQI